MEEHVLGIAHHARSLGGGHQLLLLKAARFATITVALDFCLSGGVAVAPVINVELKLHM